MYELMYENLKNNSKKSFIVSARSLTDADKKMRSVYKEELSTSVMIKYSRLGSKTAA